MNSFAHLSPHWSWSLAPDGSSRHSNFQPLASNSGFGSPVDSPGVQRPDLQALEQLTPLECALTQKRTAKSFRIHSYKIKGLKLPWNDILTKNAGGGTPSFASFIPSPSSTSSTAFTSFALPLPLLFLFSPRRSAMLLKASAFFLMERADLLRDLIVLYGIAMAIAYLMRRARQSTVVGYLLTGVVAGPFGLRLISGTAAVEVLAEVGVALLLFTIGLELSLDKLARMRQLVLGAGSLQIVATSREQLTAAFGLLQGSRVKSRG